MTGKLSRRSLLKLGLLSFTGLAFRSVGNRFETFDFGASGTVVRVATRSVSVYKEPNDESEILYQHYFDELVNVYGKVVSEFGPDYNPVWFRVWGGYMHSAHLVEVETRLNPVISSFPEEGMLTEVTVPYTQSWRIDYYQGWVPTYRLYYGSTHWVIGIEEGPDREPWYKIEDEMDSHYIYYVPATHLRAVPDSELTPISPDLPPEAKRIEISIQEQMLRAFELENLVFETKISSGVPRVNVPGIITTDTPKGDDFHVSSKMPSKHMGNGFYKAERFDANGLPIYDYELPGVPWVTFFEPNTGVAIHGTWWHTNYGMTMSHGCVNMVSDEAKWIFRWTTPVWEPGTWEERGYGTRVIVY